MVTRKFLSMLANRLISWIVFFFQAEDGIRDLYVTGVQTCALPISGAPPPGFSYPGTAAVPLVFVPVPEPKTVQNRVHLDLASTSAEHQAALARRLQDLGARPADIGQGDVPWVVLADPEGNEFCVLSRR